MREGWRTRSFVFAFLVLCALCRVAGAEASLLINEACSANKTLWRDDFGIDSDYVELYNPTDDPVSLAGFSLSDGGATCALRPSLSVPPRGYLVLALSGRAIAGNDLHIPFKLSSASGETLTLTNAAGRIVDEVALPAMGADMSYSRQSGGGFAVVPGTPGLPNETGALWQAAPETPLVLPPMFSRASGFYDAPFSLEIKAQAGCRVYYTLDCATPTRASIPFESAIEIGDASLNPNRFSARTDITTREFVPTEALVDKAAVVRAVAADENGNLSRPVTAVYFVDFEEKRGYDDIAVASIVTDPAALFGEETGIYVTGKTYKDFLADPLSDKSVALTELPTNYFQSGRVWERAAHFTFFSSARVPLLEQDIGIRIHGNYSRDRIQKSFNLYARKEYDGRKAFAQPLFGDLSLDTMMLRASRSNNEYLRDPLGQSFCEGLNIDAQASIPCLLFLEGEYWGVYYLYTRTNERYLAQKYGVPEDDVVIIKNNRLDAGSVYGLDDYHDLLRFVRTSDLNAPAAYEKLCAMIDMDSYIDYMCAEIYLANADWPNNNEMLWKVRGEPGEGCADGKWRWALFDLDQTLGFGASPYTVDSFTNALRSPMFASLWKSERFREDFALRFMDVANGFFHEQKTVDALASMHARLSPFFAAQTRRFGLTFSTRERNATKKDFERFLTLRLPVVAPLICPDQPLRAVTLSETLPGAGDWTVNGYAPALKDGLWNGAYFANNQILVSVTENDGFYLKSLEVDGEARPAGQPLTLSMDAPHTVRAVFEERANTCDFTTLQDGVSTGLAAGFTGDARMYATRNVRITSPEDGRFALSPKEGWGPGDGILFSLSTAGCEKIEICLTLLGDRKAPRDFAAAYSIGGEAFVPIDNQAISLENATRKKVRIQLPKACEDQYRLYLRIGVASGFRIDGKERLYGSDKGEIAFSGVRVEGLRGALTYAELLHTRRVCASWLDAYTQLRETLSATAGRVYDTQTEIDRARRTLVEAFTQTALSQSAQTLGDFAQTHEVTDALWPSLCADAPIYAVPENLSALSDLLPIRAPGGKTIWVYAYDNGAFSLADTLRRDRRGFVHLDARAGVYLLLPNPIAAYSVEASVSSDYALSKDLCDAYFSGFTPEDQRLLTLKVVPGFEGAYTVSLPGWGGGAIVYAYKIEGDALGFAWEGRCHEGMLTVPEPQNGQFLLASTSMEEYALRGAYRQRALADAQSDDKEAEALSGEAYIALAAVAAALLLLASLWFENRRKRRKKKEETP